jgi:hypothetical protein
MFNDWQISHLHLGRLFVSPSKVSRVKLLLFALVKADRAVFLAVNPHGAWTATELLRILFRTSPQDLPELKGVLATQRGGWTDAELVQLRQAGLGYSIQIDGKTFSPPGLGVSTSRHAVRIVRQFNLLSKEIRNIAASGRAGVSRRSKNRLPPNGLDSSSRTTKDPGTSACRLPIRIGTRRRPQLPGRASNRPGIAVEQMQACCTYTCSYR